MIIQVLHCPYCQGRALPHPNPTTLGTPQVVCSLFAGTSQVRRAYILYAERVWSTPGRLSRPSLPPVSSGEGVLHGVIGLTASGYTADARREGAARTTKEEAQYACEGV
jgi:hypothetical protein